MRRPILAAGIMLAVVAALVVFTLMGGTSTGAGGATADAGAAPTAHRSAARPALCRATAGIITGRVTDPAADELSGLVQSRTTPGVLWSQEDSGAAPVLWALRSDGAVLGRPRVAGAGAIDWEDIATGPAPGGGALLYIADIGDNDAQRASVDVYRVREPSPAAATTAVAERLRLRYPDGPHDAEALLVDPLRGQLVIVTKVIGTARAYVASAAAPAGTTVTLRRGPAIALSLVTAGDVSADGRTIALRTYFSLAVWRRHGREPITTTLSRRPCRARSTLLVGEGQGEALALSRGGSVAYTVPEGSPAPIRRYAAPAAR